MPDIIITRPSGLADSNDKFISKLRELGFTVHWLKVLECKPIVSPDVEIGIAALIDGDYSWLVLGSRTAVKALKYLVKDKDLSSIKVAVQGPGTAAEFEKHFSRAPNLIPRGFVAEDFLEALKPQLKSGDKILLTGAKVGRDVVYDGLKNSGFDITKLSTYQTTSRIPPNDETPWVEKVNFSSATWIFMSPSAVEATMSWVNEVGEKFSPSNGKIISIGPITSEALKRQQLNYNEAKEHSEEGILRLLS